MSETTTEIPAAADDAEPVESVTEAPAVEAQETEAEAAPEPEKPAPRQKDRRFAHLTARIQAETTAREAAERRAAAAEALAAQLRQPAQEGYEAPAQHQPITAEQIDALAEQKAARNEFYRRLADIDATGKREIGHEAWEEAKTTLTSLGAVNNEAFLHALAETENPARVFAQLAEDPDQLADLLRRPQAAMAARIGRMDASLSKPAAPARATSNAPRPPAPVQTTSAPAEPSLYDKNLTMDQFVAQFKKEFPNSKLVR